MKRCEPLISAVVLVLLSALYAVLSAAMTCPWSPNSTDKSSVAAGGGWLAGSGGTFKKSKRC